MSIINKLEDYRKVQTVRDNMKEIKVVAVYLGAEPRLFYPKLKDSEGKNLKDEKGQDKRAETATGYTYTLSEYGSSKMIKVVLPTQQEMTPLSAWSVSGRGYDLPGLYFIEKEGSVEEY